MPFLIAIFLLFSAIPAAASPSGKDIIEKVIHQPSPDQALITVRMTLTGQNAGVRQLTTYFKRINGKANSVIKFQEPADYRGAGLLVIEKADGHMDRRIRFQGQRRVRRLPSGSQTGSFLNTDFSYEDLDGHRNIESDTHKLLREEKLNGQDCYVVETIPSPDSGSAYKRIVQWIRKDNYVPIQVEFYQDGAQPVKRLVAEEVKNIDGYWVTTKSRMTTLAAGTSTELDVVKTDFKTNIPDSTFTDQFLLE